MTSDKDSKERMVEGEHQPISIDDTRHAMLMELADYRMPFGKYSGCRLVDLPEPYVVWFAQNGFPRGKLGEMFRIVYEIKVNGLEYLFDPLK